MISWNRVMCWILFPLLVSVNTAALNAGFLWLILWWLAFYTTVEFYNWNPERGMPWEQRG